MKNQFTYGLSQSIAVCHRQAKKRWFNYYPKELLLE